MPGGFVKATQAVKKLSEMKREHGTKYPGLSLYATITNLTCIVSPNGLDTATHDPGAGWRIREGHFPVIRNSIVTTAYSADSSPADPEGNYCIRIEDAGEQAALDGDLVIGTTIVACQDLTDGDLEGQSTAQWLTDNGNAVYQVAEAGEDPTEASNAALAILDGFYSLPANDMVVDGAALGFSPDGATFIGGVIASDDWTQGWTYGLHPENRGQPLWFE